jgi:dienelactone hydrolase
MRSLLALAVLLATTIAARAADDCLVGSPTLADQRALAALRADTETRCPCATTTPRSAWRRCAKAVLAETLELGGIRAGCKKTASRDLKASTCGSTQVACGRVRRGAAESPASCKVKASCKDSNKFEVTACAGATHCSDVVTWTAGTCDDPREDGPFVAGVRVLPLVRTSSVQYCQGGAGSCGAQPFGDGCPCSAGTACASGVCSTEPRLLDTLVFYPAPPGSGPVDPEYNAVVDAPLDPSAGPYPIVMFSHGSCGYANQSTFLWPGVASRGYVVVSPPHPGNTLFEFPTCGTPAAQAASFVERPTDIVFALDSVLAGSAEAAFLAGALDADRIAMTGHSFGGLTTFRVAAIEPRITVAVPMAPAIIGVSPLAVPSMLMMGAIDSVVDNDAALAMWAQGTTPRLAVAIEHAGHYAFSTGCFPGPDCNPPTTLDQNEAHAVVRRWVLPFLDRYLKGDPAAEPFLLPPAPPGVTVTAAP